MNHALPADQQLHIDMRTAHIFLVDYFLPLLASHGYAIQKSQKKLNFNDIDQWFASVITLDNMMAAAQLQQMGSK
jgi:hypothetical protein